MTRQWGPWVHMTVFMLYSFSNIGSAIITICILWSLKRLKKAKIRYRPLWLDRAREKDGLLGATLAEIFVAYNMASVLNSSSQMKLPEFT